MLFLMACHDVSIGNPCDAEFVLSEPSLYTYSLRRSSVQLQARIRVVQSSVFEAERKR